MVLEAERKFRIAAMTKTPPTAIWCRRPEGVALDDLIYATVAGFVKKFKMFPTAIYMSQKNMRELSRFSTSYYIRYPRGAFVVPYEIATIERVCCILDDDVIMCIG